MTAWISHRTSQISRLVTASITVLDSVSFQTCTRPKQSRRGWKLLHPLPPVLQRLAPEAINRFQSLCVNCLTRNSLQSSNSVPSPALVCIQASEPCLQNQ